MKLEIFLGIKVVPRQIRPYDEFVFFLLKEMVILFEILFFMILFIVIYFVYNFIFESMLKKEKYTKISELGLLVRKFSLDKKKMNYKQCLNGVALINAFIISFTIVLIDALKVSILFKLGIAFIIMVILILVLYYLYGIYLKKKWGK